MAPRSKYAGWTKARRFDAAIRAVVHDNMPQTKAAIEFGVSRSQLNPKCRDYRAAYEERLREEAERPRVGLSPFGLNENRRMPGSFQEWDDYYFPHWECPDCGEHHDRKPFHDEMVNAVLGPERRVVENVPPFHAKSTYVTVKTTIHQLCENPNTRQIVVSKSQPFSETFLESIGQLLTNEELYLSDRNLIRDFGPFRSDNSQQVWNRRQIYVAGRMTAEKDPTIQCLGVGNQIYGRRADRIILDDIADTDNQRNPDQVAKMLGWLDKMVHSRVGKNGKIAYVGTRIHAGDIYATFKQRAGWKVITYPCILDDVTEEVLWPEHFPYSQAMLFRNDMTTADFQLIYQNVDIPGLGASFTQEAVDGCKDVSRKVGDYENEWRLVAGLDPAGGNKGSGETAFTLVGIDLRTGNRFLIDQVAVKSMRAPQLRDQMFEWTDRYPIYEWRVESNGLQSQLVQYNEEIIKHLARKGVRVVPHFTHNNKWDAEFGVESTAPLFNTGQISIPWGNAPSAQTFQPFVEQLVAFPMGTLSDRVMSFWFADLGCREFLSRSHLPLFNDRMRVPSRVRRRRHLVDFYNQTVSRIPIEDQRPGKMIGARPGGGREGQGRPRPWGDFEEIEPDAPVRYANLPTMVPVGGRVQVR